MNNLLKPSVLPVLVLPREFWVVLDSNSLSAIATFDSPRLCSVMIFLRIIKHFVIFECTKFLTPDATHMGILQQLQVQKMRENSNCSL